MAAVDMQAARPAMTAPPVPDPPTGADPIGSLRQPGRAVVQGRLHAAEVRPGQHGGTVLACEVPDSTGELTAVFYGRTSPAWSPAAGSGCVAWPASAPTAGPP